MLSIFKLALDPEILNTNSLLKEAQKEMLQLYNFKLKGIQIRSRARWVEDGKKNSKYFLNLEKGIKLRIRLIILQKRMVLS